MACTLPNVDQNTLAWLLVNSSIFKANFTLETTRSYLKDTKLLAIELDISLEDATRCLILKAILNYDKNLNNLYLFSAFIRTIH